MTEAGEKQLLASLSTALSNGDATTFATIKSENPQVYNLWLSQNYKNAALNDPTFQKAVNTASATIQQTNDTNWAIATDTANNNLYGDDAAAANTAIKTTNQSWEQFDLDNDGKLSGDEISAYNASKTDDGQADFYGSSGTYGTASTGDAIKNWGSDTFSTESGLGSLPTIKENASTIDAATSGDWDAVAGDLINPKDYNNPLNLVEAATDTIGEVTEDIPLVDALGDKISNLGSGLNGMASDIYNRDVGGFFSDATGTSANYAQTALGQDIDDTDNPDGYQFDTDSWIDTGNEVKNEGMGGATENVVEELEEQLTGGDDNDEGGGTSSNLFSNADEVNKILTEGTQAAQQTYGEQTATALQPLTEAKDAYNYTDQLDNYNQDWTNYKEQTASNNAYLDTQKDAAQNWETYMNPLTEYLNKQIAENTRAGYGSMMSSSAAQNAVNKAITDNTAAQYQNAVNTAMTNSQNNQAIANSQQNNANSYLTGANQTLTNNVTPTTDWTAYMTDYADTNLNTSNNLVNAQAQIASQEPTGWDKITDLVSAGTSVLGAIGSWLGSK